MPHDTRSPAQPDPFTPGQPAAPGVDLYWIPLGAGSRIVQTSGRVFEAASARRHRRPRQDLYHAALEVIVPLGRFSIEQASVPDRHGEARGVVAVGPVGIRAAGRLRWFRYEVRCWRDGIIPDLADAVGSPVRLTSDTEDALRVLDVLPAIPTPVWGRDEATAGEMWNSNSVIAWVLTRSGIDLDAVRPPLGGRAPGWAAGQLVANADRSGVNAPMFAPSTPAVTLSSAVAWIRRPRWGLGSSHLRDSSERSR